MLTPEQRELRRTGLGSSDSPVIMGESALRAPFDVYLAKVEGFEASIRAGQRAGIPVAMCGEMAGDSRFTRLLLGLGLKEFSVHPSSLLEVKQVLIGSDADSSVSNLAAAINAVTGSGVKWGSLTVANPYVTAAGKVTVTQEAMKVVDEAFQLFGGAGTSREYPIEKLYRDARVTRIYEGTNEIQRLVAARQILRALG